MYNQKMQYLLINLACIIFVLVCFVSSETVSQVYQHWVKKYKGEDYFHDDGVELATNKISLNKKTVLIK